MTALDFDKLAAFLRRAREWRGLRIAAASRRSGVARTTIRSIEKRRREGTLGTFARLADAYGFRLSDLIRKCERGERR